MPKPIQISRRLGRTLAAACVLLLLPACGSGPAAITEPTLPSDPPDDFALAVTIFAPEVDAEAISALPRSVRPARYVVEPDGVLRAAIGPGADPDVFPAQTRRLTDRQRAQLWRLVRDQGLLATNHPGRIATDRTYLSSPDRRAVLVEIAGADQRRYLELHADDRASDPAVAVALTDRLAELAWLRN